MLIIFGIASLFVSILEIWRHSHIILGFVIFIIFIIFIMLIIFGIASLLVSLSETWRQGYKQRQCRGKVYIHQVSYACWVSTNNYENTTSTTSLMVFNGLECLPITFYKVNVFQYLLL